jgi:hypothetical protein
VVGAQKDRPFVNPLGRFAEPAATVIAIGAVLAAILGHLFSAQLGSPDLTFIDSIALVAVGAVYGRSGVSQALNGTVSTAHQALLAANAANSRVDKLEGMPPPHSPVTVVVPPPGAATG